MSERDTHFAGFAQLLLDEMMEKYAWIEPFQGEGSEMDDVRTHIARRAFDLVTHALNDFFGDGCVELTENVKGEGALFAASTPDLAVWPEPDEPHPLPPSP